jgi:hypothetical protein
LADFAGFFDGGVVRVVDVVLFFAVVDANIAIFVEDGPHGVIFVLEVVGSFPPHLHITVKFIDVSCQFFDLFLVHLSLLICYL